MGDRRHVTSLDSNVVGVAPARIDQILGQGIEKMKPSKDPLPVVLVGGGSLLAMQPLAAGAETLRPKHAVVANAIGAAIAQIGGESERLVSYDKTARQTAIEEVAAVATQIAVASGADPATVRVADVEETGLSYMADSTTR